MPSTKIVSTEYREWLKILKQNYQSSQLKASIAVNSTLLEFYWHLGGDIVQMQKEYQWGSGFLQQLSNDLACEFPDIKGFSFRNLKYIRQWFLFWQPVVALVEKEKGKQLVAQLVQIPWGHNIVIIQKCKNSDEALYYMNNTLQNGISRSVLIHQIESNLYEREGKAITNFEATQIWQER